jgi:hypothetical protein
MGMNLHGRGERVTTVKGMKENGPWELSHRNVPEGESIEKYGIM